MAIDAPGPGLYPLGRDDMKTYFLRHGIAVEEADWKGEEADRPLSAEGEALMEREALAIASLGIGPDLILTSPLARAAQTARIVARALGIEDRICLEPRLGPGFDLARLAAILKERKTLGSILLVGHEPGLSTTIGELIGGARVSCKKGSLACVKLKDPGQARGELFWLLPPEVLAGMRD